MATPPSTALFYLARGAGAHAEERFGAFARSYQGHAAGLAHQLYVIFKGFDSEDSLERGKASLAPLRYQALHTDDLSFDIGAYYQAARQVTEDRVCFLNTNSEIACQYWLGKLSRNLDLPRVGVVGATASFESLKLLDRRFPPFPNAHLRSNAFMMERTLFLDIFSRFQVRDKVDAFFAESGPDCLTRRVFAMGLSALLVGRNGRGYAPSSWARSMTFRQGCQDNLLVKDNVTRAFDHMSMTDKMDLSFKSWGNYINRGVADVIPGGRL